MGTSSAGAEPGVLEAILLFYPSAVQGWRATGRGGAQVRHPGGGAARRDTAACKCDIQEAAEARRRGAGLVEHALVARKMGIVGLVGLWAVVGRWSVDLDTPSAGRLSDQARLAG
jgi:hypothetical protein